MKAKQIRILAAGAVLAAVSWLAAGCEEAQTDSALAVTPAKSRITGKGATVVLTVFDPDQAVYDYSEIYDDENEAGESKASMDSGVAATNQLGSQILLPLIWEVSDPALGRIAASAGYSAVYESAGGKGQNYVKVRDQIGRKGVAAVEQRTTFTTNTVTTTETDVDGDTTTEETTTSSTHN